jgi:hypothetical protein
MLITLCSPREGSTLENEDPVHNEPLPHLNSTYCDHTPDIVKDEEHAESRGFPQQNDTESQIENADAPPSIERNLVTTSAAME